MPFKSKKQEIAMRIKAPKVWKKWVDKYGHYKPKKKKGKKK